MTTPARNFGDDATPPKRDPLALDDHAVEVVRRLRTADRRLGALANGKLKLVAEDEIPSLAIGKTNPILALAEVGAVGVQTDPAKPAARAQRLTMLDADDIAARARQAQLAMDKQQTYAEAKARTGDKSELQDLVEERRKMAALIDAAEQRRDANADRAHFRVNKKLVIALAILNVEFLAAYLVFAAARYYMDKKKKSAEKALAEAELATREPGLKAVDDRLKALAEDAKVSFEEAALARSEFMDRVEDPTTHVEVKKGELPGEVVGNALKKRRDQARKEAVELFRPHAEAIYEDLLHEGNLDALNSKGRLRSRGDDPLGVHVVGDIQTAIARNLAMNGVQAAKEYTTAGLSEKVSLHVFEVMKPLDAGRSAGPAGPILSV